LVPRAQPADPAPDAPNGGANAAGGPPAGRAGAAGPRDQGKLPPRDPIDDAKKDIEALRRRVEALEDARTPPPAERPKIVVTSPQARDVVVTQHYVGKIVARRHMSVRALATGVVAEVTVQEGQAVKTGDALFKVLPTLYKAKLDAELAEVRIARLELNNAKKLFEQKVVSPQEVALSEAKLARAEARVKLAEAELSSTVVKAPFDGLVGRLQEQEGSLVKEGGSLTTLSDDRTVWVYFNVPEARYLAYMADRDRMKEGAPIELVLANGSTFPQAGRLGAIGGQVETETGGIPFRADFPNPDGLLRHGQTGNVSVRESLKGALVIPQRATFETSGKRCVYVVGKGDVAHRREIVVRAETNEMFVIQSGLGAGDRIVVDGVRQVRDGEKVEYEFRKPDAVVGDPKKPVGN